MTQTLPIPAAQLPNHRRPAGPRGFSSAITNVLEAWRDPLGLMARELATHGDIVRLRFGWIDYYVVNHPDGVHRVLVENHKNYEKSRNYQGLKVILGQGLLTSEGEQWKKQRKLAQPAFHRERLAGFAREMSRCTVDMLDRWERELVLPAKPRFDLHREMMRLTLRIVGKTLFSTDLDGDAKSVGEALTVALEWSNKYVESIVRIPPWVPTPNNMKFRRAKATIDGLATRLIGERRAAGNTGDDLLGMLMEARDEASGEHMSDQQLRDELLTLVLAGHETTANALSFAFYLLSRHPDVARRLSRELDEVLGARPATLEDLPRLTYTKAVVEEAMRLFPPAWVVERQPITDDVVMGYSIPKGSIVGICSYLLHRHSTLWPNPEGFDPDRFIDTAEERPKYAYLPFGGGPRFCIGNAFAMMEMQIILATIAQRHRLELAPGFALALDPSVTLRPKSGVPMSIVPR